MSIAAVCYCIIFISTLGRETLGSCTGVFCISIHITSAASAPSFLHNKMNRNIQFCGIVTDAVRTVDRKIREKFFLTCIYKIIQDTSIPIRDTSYCNTARYKIVLRYIGRKIDDVELVPSPIDIGEVFNSPNYKILSKDENLTKRSSFVENPVLIGRNHVIT